MIEISRLVAGDMACGRQQCRQADPIGIRPLQQGFDGSVLLIGERGGVRRVVELGFDDQTVVLVVVDRKREQTGEQIRKVDDRRTTWRHHGRDEPRQQRSRKFRRQFQHRLEQLVSEVDPGSCRRRHERLPFLLGPEPLTDLLQIGLQ
ncbi:hypothetical protein [Nocardia sp. CA-120079]|uniref:hypothetical protein n=1 Tax=Nocardia sp. CA-120079 TaxID=3239974 RepID=UPI003D983C66